LRFIALRKGNRFSDALRATACWIDIWEKEGAWKKIGPIALADRPFGVIEPCLFFDAQGALRMLCRDRAHKIGKTGYIWMAISQDMGLHWSALQKTALPNPDAAFDAADLGDGHILLIYNHSHTQRYPLHLAVSHDGGDTWSSPIVLEAHSGEFPAAILSSDGLVHLTYAWRPAPDKQRRIKHMIIDPAHIE
jgi:predicted neuraminidase